MSHIPYTALSRQSPAALPQIKTTEDKDASNYLQANGLSEEMLAGPDGLGLSISDEDASGDQPGPQSLGEISYLCDDSRD